MHFEEQPEVQVSPEALFISRKKVFKPQFFIIYMAVKLSFGQRAADRLTMVMGSWIFIIIFVFFLIAWSFTNGYFLVYYIRVGAFDPYPFIFLNLVLSCLAAIQAPIILMSQNRQVEKDHTRFEYDYAVNRKAEREISNIQKDLEIIKKMIRKIKKK